MSRLVADADAGDISRMGEMMADSCIDDEALLVKLVKLKSKSRPANVCVPVTDDECGSADTGGGDVSGTGVDRLGE